jgi:hypothetical protein
MTPDLDEQQDRRQFLRRFGKTVAVGLGFGLLPAAAARGTTQAPTYCCPDLGAHCQGQYCPIGLTKFWCSSIGCCACDSRQYCVNFEFPPC